MKRSNYKKTVSLVKTFLAEEKTWGEAEVLGRAASAPVSVPAPAAKMPVKAPVKVPAVTPVYSGALEAYRKEIENCVKCPLGKTRIKFVFGVGNPAARLMFIGEGPGYEEDRRGEPFVGKAGQLLTKIIEAMGMKREDVYIANIVKCHPMVDPSDPEKHGNDRPPTPEETAACRPYLDRQIELIKPRVICTLGASSTKTLLSTEAGISTLRGRYFDYKGTPLMPTYHPAALLRNPSLKKDVWEDMKKIMATLANNG
jgi:uracil-DNA glycosylase